MEAIILQGITLDQFRSIIREEVEIQTKQTLEDELLSREEAAEFLKIHLSTLDSWRRSGTIKAKGIGNRVYFSKNDLIKSLEELK